MWTQWGKERVGQVERIAWKHIYVALKFFWVRSSGISHPPCKAKSLPWFHHIPPWGSYPHQSVGASLFPRLPFTRVTLAPALLKILGSCLLCVTLCWLVALGFLTLQWRSSSPLLASRSCLFQSQAIVSSQSQKDLERTVYI